MKLQKVVSKFFNFLHRGAQLGTTAAVVLRRPLRCPDGVPKFKLPITRFGSICRKLTMEIRNMRCTGVQPRAMQANVLHRVLSLPPQAIYTRAAVIDPTE